MTGMTGIEVRRPPRPPDLMQKAARSGGFFHFKGAGKLPGLRSRGASESKRSLAE